MSTSNTEALLQMIDDNDVSIINDPLEEMTKENKKLRDQNQTLKKQLELKNKQYDAQKKTSANVQDHADTLKKKIASYEQKIKQLETDKSKIRNVQQISRQNAEEQEKRHQEELAKQKADFQEKEHLLIQKYEREEETLKLEIEGLKIQIEKNAKNGNQKLLSEITTLKSKLSRVEVELSNKNTEVGQLYEKINSLSSPNQPQIEQKQPQFHFTESYFETGPITDFKIKQKHKNQLDNFNKYLKKLNINEKKRFLNIMSAQLDNKFDEIYQSNLAK